MTKTRRLTLTVACALSVLAIRTAASTRAVADEDFVPIFNGSNLNGWKTQHTKARVHDGVVRVGKGNGWIRADRVYADFVLRLDVRLTAEDGKAGVFVRSWPTFDESLTPNNGYRLTLAATGGRPPDGRWRRVEIECAGSVLTARLDGSLVHRADAVANPQGFVALWATGAAAEFRSIEIRELALPDWELSPNASKLDGDAAPPRVKRSVKHSYTAQAQAAQIQGTVLLSAVVQPDGSVSDVVIRRSLDPRFGLDRQAVAAARQWRFHPGTRNGRPVPVEVMLELAFTLK